MCDNMVNENAPSTSIGLWERLQFHCTPKWQQKPNPVKSAYVGSRGRLRKIRLWRITGRVKNKNLFGKSATLAGDLRNKLINNG